MGTLEMHFPLRPLPTIRTSQQQVRHKMRHVRHLLLLPPRLLAGRLRRRGRLLRIRLRLRHRRFVRAQRHGPERPARRDRVAHAVPGLHRPLHVHPLRRWRGSSGGHGLRRERWRPRRDGADDRPRWGLHDLVAVGRIAQPVELRDDGARFL